MAPKIFATAAICLLGVISSIAAGEDPLDVKAVYLNGSDMAHFYSSEIRCSTDSGCAQMKINRSVTILFSKFKQDFSIKFTPYIQARGFIDLNQKVNFEKTGGCEALFDSNSPCDHKLPTEARYVGETRQISSREMSWRMVMMSIQIDVPVNVRGNLHLELEITRPDGSTETRDIPVRWPSGDIPRIQ